MKHKPLLNKRKPGRGSGGYARKDTKNIEKSVVPGAMVQKKPRKPLPPGLRDALVAKHLLSKDLATMTRTHYVVSVDLLGEEWVLVVRGYAPPFDAYAGYQVKWMKSSIVRNPLSKNNMVGDIY